MKHKVCWLTSVQRRFYKRQGLVRVVLLVGLASSSAAYSGATALAEPPVVPDDSVPTSTTPASTSYLIGPGDTLQVFVWRNPDLSVTIVVRPDGEISIPLVEDMPATGKSPTQLARDIEKKLAEYVRSPQVTVIVTGFVGTFEKQVRVIGQAAKPQSLPYRQSMTLLDVLIQVGGLTEYAAGNRAKIVRRGEGGQTEINVRLDDLLRGGDVGADVAISPGDILIIPEAWF